jgi:hypothetical protein
VTEHEVPELIPHTVTDLKRNQRDIRAFIASAPSGASYGFPALEALELVTEALAYAELREGTSE